MRQSEPAPIVAIPYGLSGTAAYRSDFTVLDFGLNAGVANDRNAICYIGPNESGRQEFQGPMVPGPWASLFGLPGVICANPEQGTYGEIKRNRAAGREHTVKVGDRILIDGFTFEIAPNPLHCQRGFPVLNLVTKKGK